MQTEILMTSYPFLPPSLKHYSFYLQLILHD